MSFLKKAEQWLWTDVFPPLEPLDQRHVEDPDGPVSRSFFVLALGIWMIVVVELIAR